MSGIFKMPRILKKKKAVNAICIDRFFTNANELSRLTQMSNSEQIATRYLILVFNNTWQIKQKKSHYVHSLYNFQQQQHNVRFDCLLTPPSSTQSTH